MNIYIFPTLNQVRFTEEGADELARKHGYDGLGDSYQEEFHYYTAATKKEIDSFLND